MADDNQKNADFIERVVSDAKNPPETRMLTGWFGDSGEEGYRRLYTDAELSSYVDIPDDAILYTEPLRDVQPSGGVMVWIKRDSALKQGGSAASRAARFLQGQVQQDFASAGAAGSLEKAGLRCITEVPCGEPTGFTGRCTKQPDVGGAWPCITAIPHCYEVTGFTGKCTHAPWPNPTRYIGCTYLHCPTHDLTHIPHICNVVASGQPGCAVVNPPQGGDPAQKVAAAEVDEKAAPATSIPGCGYTKTWGVCETHLLGCDGAAQGGAAAQGDAAFITSICAPTAFCHVSQNCGGAAAAEAWTTFCTRAHPPICYPTEACHTRPPQCAAFAAAAPAITGAVCVSVGGVCTNVHGCTVPPTSPDLGCTQSGPACPTKPPAICPDPTIPKTLCTQSGPQCPTSCGPECQSQQPNCTQVGEICGHKPCTQAPPECTVSDPIACTVPAVGCTGLPSCGPVTNPNIICAQAADAQAFGARAVRPAPLTPVGCPPSDFVACSLFGGCPTLPKGDCTFFGCPSLPQYAAAGPGGGCTQVGPQCPTHARPQCTFFGPGCPPTPATICTQFAPCPTHQGPQCPSQQFECTMFCTHAAPGCPQTIQNAACVGPITVGGPQCPVHSGFNCPSAIGCQSIACQSIACQPGGGGEQQAFGAAQPQAAAAIHPTIWTQIGVQCQSHLLGCTYFGAQCRTYPRGDCTFFGCPSPGIDCTVVVCTHFGPQCPPHPSLQGQLCPITIGGPQCPPASGFNCPSQICQSIACQSIACQPGGGGQQVAFAQQAVGAPQTAATVCTQVGVNCPFTSGPTICSQLGPQCPHTAGCPSPGIDCTAILCTHVGPHCPKTAGPTICTQVGPQCPHTAGCPSPGIDCTAILCTHFGPHCPNTAATVCTQSGPQCPPHPSLQGQFCPITVGSPQCPPASGFNCPSQFGCQSIACGQSVACVSAGCQPGGGGIRPAAFGAAFDQSTDFCPTSMGCGGVVQPQAIGGHTPWYPTPATRCFICPPFGNQY